MQRPMPILPPAPTLNPMKDAAKVEPIDYAEQTSKIYMVDLTLTPNSTTQIKTKNDLVRYIPGLTKPAHQRQIDGTLTKKAYADDTYKGLNVAEFNIKPTNNQYMISHNECLNDMNVYLVSLMKI